MINAIDMMNGQLMSMNGLNALVDGISAKILLSETSKDEIITDQPLHEGSIIEINSDNYLIINMDEEFNQGIYKTGQFERTLPILLGSNYKTVQATVSKYRGEFVDGQLINEVHDQYLFKISKNNMNTQSIGNDLIVYDGGLYNILSVDDSHEGILIIIGKYDTVYVPHTYTISLNSNSETLQETSTFQIVVTCTDNSETVTSPTITYTSSDPNIVSIDETGLVNCIAVGSATITCTYQNVSANLTITVEAKPAEPVISYTYAFSQSITQLKEYMTTTLTTSKTVDSVQDNTLHINYSFDSVGQSLISQSKVVITVASDSSIKIKNASVTSSTTIHLIVTDSVNGNVIVDTDIILTGM